MRCWRCGACLTHCTAASSSAYCCDHRLLFAGEGAEAHTGSVSFFFKGTAVKVIQTGMGQRFIYWFFLLIMETFILLWATGITFLIGEASYLAGSHLWEMLLLLAFSLWFKEIQSWWIQSSMEVRTWGSWSYCVPSQEAESGQEVRPGCTPSMPTPNNLLLQVRQESKSKPFLDTGGVEESPAKDTEFQQ